MKTALLFLGLSLVVAAYGLPFGGDPEYAMVPDDTEGWKLVNINEDPEPENFFTPETDIIFRLFTNDNTAGQVIQWNNPAWIESSSFNRNNPIRITIHGWNGGPTSNVNTGVRAAYFAAGQFNVIEVDWSAGAGTINYLGARNRVGPTGGVVANLVRLISESAGVDLSRFTLVGHSLGAHVAGFAGKAFGGRLGAIVALDAALPLFNINNPEGRVHVEDALYVESLHTNAGLLGFDDPLGHANFYPNFGRRQPGCGIDASGNCAHGRAHEFFAESITTTVGFWARQCRNYADITSGNCVATGAPSVMGGEPLNTQARGIFWFETNSNSPFAQGQF